ncbi:homeobox domain protein [Ceratobasidium sp. AG-Ba]|nr:homeobox domain protein [Ceratobasidium sp. AG-Ba]
MADDHDEMAYLPGSGPSLDIQADVYYPAQPGFVTAFWNPYEVKHRRRTSRAQLSVLEHEFETDPKPNADKRRALASQLNMTPRAIQVWFQNRRAKIKAIKNKIPGGRGMPKLKPGERAAARAARAKAKSMPDSDDEDEEKPDPSGQWIQLESTPLSSPTHPSPPYAAAHPDPSMSVSPAPGDRTPPASMPKPHFTIAVPPPDAISGPSSAHSGPSSPDFAPPLSSDFLAPPSPQAMLRRGSAPAPLQGIHRARYSAFNPGNNNNRTGELELGIPPVSPISPPDHEVAPLRRGSLANLARRPSLPDSHLRLPAHPYYPHSHPYDRSGSSSAPRMQRRGGLLSPVPDVGHEQEQGSNGPHVPYSLSIPTVLPPAPQPSRMYRALPPGMGAAPAAHDLPTQFPARPSLHAPTRPFATPVAGPLPAADFSFGAPEPGHGDAFNRATQGQENEMHPNSSNPDFHASNPDFHSNEYISSPNTEFNPSSATSEFAPPGQGLWDMRTRFGSMASIASDVTGVSVSSTQATSVSGGLGTAGCDNGYGDSRNGYGDARNGPGFGNGFGYGYPTGFQPDMRRASW